VALGAFSDKTHRPSDGDLQSTLGTTYSAWTHLIDLVTKRLPGITPLWGFTSNSTGWGLRLRIQERVILYMTPCQGHFLVSFALGERAVAQALAARLPKALVSAIQAAPRYAEGRGLRVPVKSIKQVRSLVTLAEAKHES